MGASKFYAAVELARLLLPPVLLGLAIIVLASEDLSGELFGRVVIDPAIHGSTVVPVTSLMFSYYFVMVPSAGHFPSPKAVDVFLKTGLPAAPYAVAGGTWVTATFTAWALARRSGLEEVLSELEERSKDDHLTVMMGVGWFVSAYTVALLVLVSVAGYLEVTPWIYPAMIPALGIVLGLAQFRVLSRLVDRVGEGWEPPYPRSPDTVVVLELIIALFFNTVPPTVALFSYSP